MPRPVVAATVAVVGPEQAATGRAKILVLPTILSGELPPDTAIELATLVSDNLVDDGIEVVPAEGTTPGCDEACRQAAAGAAGADFLVQAQVTGDEDEFNVTVTVFAGDTGQALAPFADECSICGFVEVRDMVRLRALDARAEVLRRRKEATAAVQPPVEPVVVASSDRPSAPRSRLIPAGWGLLGAGAAATVGGAVLLGLHHQSAGCLENPRGGDCVPVRYTTVIPGAAVLGTGVLAVAGGVIMVVLGRRAERRAAAGQRVAVRPHGLGLRF
ncbi:hypothetical protein OEB96_42285 [Paraliomyxa miuraensis]|nr:hypothetical protein [Paraliomyxa miuraensis]